MSRTHIDISIARLLELDLPALERLMDEVRTKCPERLPEFVSNCEQIVSNSGRQVEAMTEEALSLKMVGDAAEFIMGRSDLPLSEACKRAGVPVGDWDALIQAATARGWRAWSAANEGKAQ